jgi:hypothetical protein
MSNIQAQVSYTATAPTITDDKVVTHPVTRLHRDIENWLFQAFVRWQLNGRGAERLVIDINGDKEDHDKRI